MGKKIIKQAKPHRILLQSIVNALHTIFIDNKYADKVIEKTLKENPKFGSRDRRFIAETTYDIVRNYRLLNHLANTKDNLWEILGVYFIIRYLPMPDEREFKNLNEKTILDNYKSITDQKILQSYPDWLWEACENELGKELWEKEAKALNEQAEVVLRVNTLKTKSPILKQHLAEQEIEVNFLEGHNDALILSKRQNLFSNPLFKLGLFELQDAGSQAISEFLGVEPGMRVIDACAGGGGKTLHIAALMQNKGRIISMDITQWKLDELKKRARRATASNIERTKEIQKKILSEYSSMTKKGGQLVYSTCSVLPSENRKQVDEFLASNKDFELIKDKTILPSEGFDGFYMALIKRKN